MTRIRKEVSEDITQREFKGKGKNPLVKGKGENPCVRKMCGRCDAEVLRNT